MVGTIVAMIAGMDKRSRREWMRSWIEVGVRENLMFTDLAKRARVSERTMRRWNEKLRKLSAQRATPERAEHAFVELVERADANAPRIEMVLPGERRIVIDGTAIVEALVRLLRDVERC